MEVQEQQMQNPEIVVTPRAADEIRKIKSENNIPESHALRIGVKSGGCSGLSYVLGFDETSREADVVLSLEALTVRIDPESLSYLAGATLDFAGDQNSRGFFFDNPNEPKTCSCGQSSCR